MRILEARFHPGQITKPDLVVVGYVVWDGDVPIGRPSVQPSQSLMANFAPATMLAKLQYLVAATAPESFERLLAFKSDFWSFVEVSSAERPSRL
jgi:hypothetical protein